ncbi:hypothetical protein [Streptomyces adelaidensis]|uniref:hypothetical protein n=1 Tax=Streptomyces adelaidensis TaxID=2796465 RepID=UPI001906435D|nr:hypothetical protein [Streptomyces adelaidensis]
MVRRPVLALRPGDEVRQDGGAWFTVARRPLPRGSGAEVTWPYVGGRAGHAPWLATVECRPAAEGVGA